MNNLLHPSPLRAFRLPWWLDPIRRAFWPASAGLLSFSLHDTSKVNHMGRRIRFPKFRWDKSRAARALRNLGGFVAVCGGYLAQQPTLGVSTKETAIITGAGMLLGYLGKWLEGRYAADTDAPASSTPPAPSAAPVATALAVAALMMLASCHGREPEPPAPVAALRPPGVPPKVARRPITDNRPMWHRLKRQRANHRKPQNWH